MKINKKQLINIIILGLFLLNLGHLIFLQDIRNIQAASLWDSQEGKEEIGKAFGQSTTEDPTDPRTIAINVVRVSLGFLAIIFVILLVIAGYKWMMAAGNEEVIKDAKSQIRTAVIGLIIILAAFGITQFIVKGALWATSDAVIWPF